ncbi:MAG: class I mannose-6-phosphate isomerase, partial [Bacteroidales bacterium]|nr:class I mannose-6-phosphate isomerase [Bacteroidales bacterium]
IMNKLYPLKFQPIFKEKLWGGQNLKNMIHGDFHNLKNCGEAWLLSGVLNNETKVINGWLQENDIAELCEVYMDDLLGESVFAKYKDQFPLLFKLIDADDNLSVQVHPDDVLAQKKGEKFGKTEMWFIMQAEKNAQLISGFEKKIDEDILRKAILDKKLPEILHYENVQSGDAFFTPAGRVHAIGKGIVLAEIQQSSDATYRLYDWERLDDNGKSRPLHITDSLQAIDYSSNKSAKVPYTIRENETMPMVQCDQFITNVLHFSSPILKNFEDIDSFVVYFCTEGSFAVKFDNELTEVGYGEVVLIPSCIDSIEMYPHGHTTALEVYVVPPSKK